MPQKSDIFERLLLGAVARMPGWLVLILVISLYSAGLGVPLALGWSKFALVLANLYGTTAAGVVVLGYLSIKLEESHRRHLLDWTSDLRLLNAEEFEWLVGELFRREGWEVTETGSQDAADGNIDLKLSRGRDRAIVQCKHWARASVGVNEIREFGGTLLREGLQAKDGVFVTTSQFNRHALREAEALGLTLIDSRELYSRIEKVRRTEPCPVCTAPMALGRSPHGWWFRCVAEGCMGKRDIGRDPGVAVDFLTKSPQL